MNDFYKLRAIQFRRIRKCYAKGRGCLKLMTPDVQFFDRIRGSKLLRQEVFFLANKPDVGLFLSFVDSERSECTSQTNN